MENGESGMVKSVRPALLTFPFPIPVSPFPTAEMGLENGESGMVKTASLALLTFLIPIPVSPFPAH
jgi:hypothetical protein